MRNRSKTFLIIIIIFMVIFITSLISSDSGLTKKYETVKDLIGSITAIIGVIAIWYQMKRDKDLTEAEFINNLNNTFTTNPDIKYIFAKLQNSRGSEEDPFIDEDMIKVVDYLTFFETISNLIQRNVLNFDMINDLFSYRFFIIVHNIHIQDREIIPDNSYYGNLYTLHKLWVHYRKKNNLDIPYESKSLEKRDSDYYKYLKGRKYVFRYKVKLSKWRKANSLFGDNKWYWERKYKSDNDATYNNKGFSCEYQWILFW